MGKPVGVRTVLVCAGLLGVFASTACGGTPREQTATAIEVVSPVGDIRPPASAIPLPSDRAVGDGIAVYRPGRDSGPVLLVTADGAQYELPVLGNTTPPSPIPSPGASKAVPLPLEAFEIDPLDGVMVSPGGHWLVRRIYPDRSEVRDLRGARVVPIEHRSLVWGWSPSGDKMLVESRAEDRQEMIVLDLVHGTRTAVRGCGEFGIGAVLDNGDLLCAPPIGNMENPFHPRIPGVADFRVVRADGSPVREFSVDLRDRITDREQAVRLQSVSADGRILVVGSERERGRIFVASLADGTVTAEVTWPSESVHGYPVWRVGGFDGGQVVLVREVEFSSPSPVYQPYTVAVWTPGSQPVALATFPRRARVTLRSSAGGVPVLL